MYHASFSPASSSRNLVLRAARCRRAALDQGTPVMPALFAALDVQRCGILAPVLDSLIGLFEQHLGRRFHSNTNDTPGLSGDEQRLLELLRAAEIGRASVDVSSSLAVAMRSSVIMIRLALSQARLPRRPRLISAR